MATQTLERNLDRICRRIRLLLAVRWCARFSLGGALLSLLALLIALIAHASLPSRYVVLFLGGCALGGFLCGWLRRVTPFQAALATDARLGTQECLSSAVDLLPSAATDPMVAALVTDAARHAEAVDVHAAYPLRAPRETRYLAGALLLLALALFLPTLPIFQSPRQRAERKALKSEGERIVRLAKEMRKAATVPDAELNRRIARNLEQLGKEMRAARLSKKQALVKLNKLTKEVAEAQQRLARARTGKSLAQASEELKKAAENAARTPEAAGTRRLRAMAAALAKEDPEQAARVLQEMAEQAASGKLSAQERQQLADEARKMAQSLSGTELQQAARQLQQAARQLQQNRTASAAQQFQQAGGT